MEEITEEPGALTERVAALDIGKAQLTACIRVPHEDKPGARRQQVRSYATTTPALLGLRDLTRYRRILTQERTREKQRAEKLLEDAQIKLSVVISDIFGASGRAMLDALIGGQTSPHQLAAPISRPNGTRCWPAWPT